MGATNDSVVTILVLALHCQISCFNPTGAIESNRGCKHSALVDIANSIPKVIIVTIYTPASSV